MIRAEALIKSNDFTGALDALNELRAYYATGAHLSQGYVDDYGLQYDAYDAADFAPGGIENSDNVTANAALLREILEERYITLTGQLEGFNDVRRTNNFLGLLCKTAFIAAEITVSTIGTEYKSECSRSRTF